MMKNTIENVNKIRKFQFFLHWKFIRCYCVYLSVNVTIAEWPPSLNKQLMRQVLWSKILCERFHVLIQVCIGLYILMRYDSLCFLAAWIQSFQNTQDTNLLELNGRQERYSYKNEGQDKMTRISFTCVVRCNSNM